MTKEKLSENYMSIIAGGNPNKELLYRCKNYMSLYQKFKSIDKENFQNLCKKQFGHVVPYEFLKVEMRNIIDKKQSADFSDIYYINCFLNIMENFNNI